jgi:hypothetical protein
MAFYQRHRLANTPPEKRKFLRKSLLWSEEFTAKLFCNVEFCLERLPKLIGTCERTVPKFRIPGLTLSPFHALDPFISRIETAAPH